MPGMAPQKKNSEESPSQRQKICIINPLQREEDECSHVKRALERKLEILVM